MLDEGAEPDSATKIIYNDFIAGFKEDEGIDNLSDRADCIWVMGSHAQAAAPLNWVKDAHNLTEVNTPTWTLNRGYTGNTTDMSLDTNYNISTDGVQASQNDILGGVYSRTASAEAGSDFGWFDSVGSGGMVLTLKDASNDTRWRINTNAGVAVSVNNTITSEGLILGDRGNATQETLSKNGVSIETESHNSDSLSNLNCYMLAINLNAAASGFSGRELFFGIIGSSSINKLNLNNRVQTLATALGASV